MHSEREVRLPKVLQLGAGPTASSALEALAERFDVVGLVRECPPEAVEDDETIRLAQSLGVPILSNSSLGAIGRYIDELVPECVVVSSYGRVLPPELLSKCRFVNVHYAPLPRYRGRANVNWAIINGERSTAITIHTICPGLDAGNILYQEIIDIGESEDVAGLYNRLNAIQRGVLAATVQRHLDGDEGVPQDDRGATYCCTRIPDDGEIDWSRSTININMLIRSLVHPLPGAFTFLECRRLVIWRAEPVIDPPRYEGRVPGRVISVSKKGGFIDILTGDGVLRILEVQREGETRKAAAEVIRSVRSTLGLRKSDLLARIERLERLLAGWDPAQG